MTECLEKGCLNDSYRCQVLLLKVLTGLHVLPNILKDCFFWKIKYLVLTSHVICVTGALSTCPGPG